MSAKSTMKGGPAFGDPYKILGLNPGASDAEITKAYRQLALKLHPDKQKKGTTTASASLTAAETEQLNKQFHDVKEARSFLLDPENREWRIQYDAKMASQRLRREEEERREKGMSDYRKKLRDELRRKEAEEAKRMKGVGTTIIGKRRKQRESDDDKDDEDNLHNLRKEGSKMREDFAQRAAHEAAKRHARQQKEAKVLLEDRQVRLKWSRSRIQISPSEHSLATLLSRFGQVESVEMIGSKGNSALVTFVNASSCPPCVQAYAESDEMRATFVGKRKREELLNDTGNNNNNNIYNEQKQHSGESTVRDWENLEERKIRQAEERERLRRQLEEGDNEDVNDDRPNQAVRDSRPVHQTLFPLPFPDCEEYNGLLPGQKLEKAEEQILGGILPRESLQRVGFLFQAKSS